MTLVKCPNGHYYDSSRFGNNCPHCGMSGAASIGADQTTVPLNIPDAPQPANAVTEPLTVSQPVVSQPANVTVPIVSDDDRTLPVTADMLDGMVEKPAPVVGWLVCTDGVNKGTDYRLHQGRNFIGRSPEMDVCIENIPFFRCGTEYIDLLLIGAVGIQAGAEFEIRPIVRTQLAAVRGTVRTFASCNHMVHRVLDMAQGFVSLVVHLASPRFSSGAIRSL